MRKRQSDPQQQISWILVTRFVPLGGYFLLKEKKGATAQTIWVKLKKSFFPVT
jgi:hypothetical protein